MARLDGFQDHGGSAHFVEMRLHSSASDEKEAPETATPEERPAVKGCTELAAGEVDRLAVLGKIFRRKKDGTPPDLRLRPSKLFVRPGKVWAVLDWSNSA